MQDELVDIVDENMNFLKIVPKGEAHSSGLLHKCVIGMVIDSQGRYLLVKQSKGRQDPGQYVAPAGGHVSAGEENETALKREVFEELGIANFKYEFMGWDIFNREVLGRKENHLFLIYKVFSDQEPVLNDEGEDYEYLQKMN